MAGEDLLLFRREVLVAQKNDAMQAQGAAQFGHRRGAQRGGGVDAGDFRAAGAAQQIEIKGLEFVHRNLR